MKYSVNARNPQGAFYHVGNFNSLSTAISKARQTLGKGWKVEVTEFQSDILVKEWVIRK